MTQEEKQLLLKDLCARLPYGVQLTDGVDTYRLTSPFLYRYVEMGLKPYLRSMSSMTDEEKKIMRSCGFELIHYDTGYTGFANIETCIDEVSFRFMDEFLIAHHFDYRGLIPIGLALEAPMDMYKTEYLKRRLQEKDRNYQDEERMSSKEEARDRVEWLAEMERDRRNGEGTD